MLTPEQRDWLRLIMVPGVGSTTFVRLLARFHSPTAVLHTSQSTLREVVGQALAERIGQYADAADIATQERLMERAQASLITLEDPAYPPRLAEIYDPPLALFMRGDLVETDEVCVAIVGTRRASPYGLSMAEKLGRELALRGVTVVSGMAGGIDAAAHKGVIEAGGRTIAVLGNGVDVVYPPHHDRLMNDIIHHGCVVSQYLMGEKPARGYFPYRNRIISGLTLGTVVIEAHVDSGALITARQAAEQGREVFAVPGQVGMRNSEGPHSLIREGAKLVETVDDILVELDLPLEVRQKQWTKPTPAPSPSSIPPHPLPQQKNHPTPSPQPTEAISSTRPIPRDASPVEQHILSVLAPDGSFVDEIAATCRISISEALSSLTILELKGLIRQFSGKRFARI